MATYLQRMQAVGDALINGSATAAQLGRLGEALAIHGSAHAEYVIATNAGKAEIAIRVLRSTLLGIIKTAEGNAAIEQARSNSDATVDSDFTQT